MAEIKSKCIACGFESAMNYYLAGADGVEPICGPCLADRYIVLRDRCKRLKGYIVKLQEKLDARM